MLHPLDREKESDPTERQGTGNERKGISTFTALTAKTPGAPAVRAFWKQQLETKFHGRKKMKRLTAAMAIAALAAGAHGIMVEVHPRPEEALSDGPQALTFELWAELMARVREFTNPQPQSQ